MTSHGRNRRLLLATAAVASLTVAPVRAQELLPLYGGDVRSVVFDPNDARRAFAGTASGQIYRSEDGGRSWNAPGREIAFPGRVVDTLVFDSGTPARLWAGLWGLWGGGGIAVSEDAGATWSWRSSDELAREPVYTVAFGPEARGTIYAGTRGGVWRSRDDGAHWSKVSIGVAGLEQVSSLAVDPRRPDRVVAGTWRRAFRSDDGGESWDGVFDGMVLDTEVFHLVASDDEPGRLWAATCGWVYRGEGFGDAWKRLRSGLSERRTPALDVLSARRVLAGTVQGVFVSEDGGMSFRPAAAPPFGVHALAHHPSAPDRVLAATEGGGIWRSEDGGTSFVASAEGIGALRVAALATHGGRLWAALSWSGPVAALQSSGDAGASFRSELAPPGTIVGLASRDERLYAATEESLFLATDGGWRAIPLGAAAGERLLRLDANVEGVEVSTASARWRLEGGVLREVARGDGVAEQARALLLPTGSRLWPRVDARGSVLRLLGSTGRATIEIPTDLPSGAIRAAAVLGDRLLIGTSGYGLRAVRLDSTQAEAALQPSLSDSTMRR